jgi:hypothetical protein
MINLMNIVERHFTELKVISSAGIVLSEEVSNMCRQNARGFRGTNLTCPPAVPSLDVIREKIDRYDTVIMDGHELSRGVKVRPGLFFSGHFFILRIHHIIIVSSLAV